LDKDHVISLIHPDNRPSIRVAEKLGERPYGRTRVKDLDVVVYRLERAEWAARSQGGP